MCSLIGFAAGGSPVLGVNYDFYFGHGLLATGRRGVDKYAMSDDRDRLTWRTAHGSVTLNQFGCELPTAGMNDAGLVVHLLECEGAEYPPPVPGRPQLIELQWIQYVLDTCADIDAALATLERVSLSRGFFGLHFALADPRGIAFVGPEPGGWRVQRAAPGPVALSNTPLPVALADARGERVRGSLESLRRYRTLRARAARYRDDQDGVDFAFSALDRVAKRPGALVRIVSALLGHPRGASVWQTVFLPAERRLVLSTLGDRRRKSLALDALDLSAQATSLLWDLEAQAEGDLRPHLRPYSGARNAALIRRVYRYFRQHVPAEDQVRIAAFPDPFHAPPPPGSNTPQHDGSARAVLRRAS
jgi:choloylglycine hydrolase